MLVKVTATDIETKDSSMNRHKADVCSFFFLLIKL